MFILQKLKKPPDEFFTNLFFASAIILIFGGLSLYRLSMLLKYNLNKVCEGCRFMMGMKERRSEEGVGKEWGRSGEEVQKESKRSEEGMGKEWRRSGEEVQKESKRSEEGMGKE